MIERVVAQIERYKMFSPGIAAGVAVSGGADSMCLLYVLREIAPRWNLHLSVVHIDHGIRGEASRADAEFVRQQAAALGLFFHLHEANLSSTDENLEQAARKVRQEFYGDLIASGAVDRVATGHTRSDQAETVLYRLFRGAGLAGLRGVLPVTNSGLVRPLLDVTREEIEAWLRERGIEWREDETNLHRTFARNRLRHEFLPMIREAFNPRLDEVLAHLAVLAQDEEDWWRRELGPVPARIPVYLNVLELAAEHPAISRRLIRQALERIKGDLRQVNFSHVETVLEMARSRQGSGRVQLPGVDVFRSFDWIRIAPAGHDTGRERNFRLPMTIPGEVKLPFERGILKVEFRSSRDKVKDEIDWRRLPLFPETLPAGQVGVRSGLLELRNWRPGDQYRRIGQLHSEKLKTLFQEWRIPLWQRRHWPVLVLGERIVWSRLFGVAEEFAAGPETDQVLRVTEEQYPEL